MIKQTLSTMASLSLLMATPVMAQDGFEVEESTSETTNQDTTKYTFVNFGTKYLRGTGGNRYIFGATAGIDYPIDDGKVYLKTNVSKQQLELKLEQKTWAKAEYPSDPAERKIKINKTYTNIEEAFVEKSIGNFSFSAGRSKIVFSDAPGITPLSYLTPSKTLSSGFEGAKLDALLPQDNIQLAYNISNNLELRGYYIKGANVDTFVKEAMKSAKQINPSNSSTTWTESETKLNDKVDGSNALLLTYYPSWGEVKLLYSKGHDMNGFQKNSTIKQSDDTIGGKSYTTYTLKGEYELAKATAYGFSTDWKYGKIDMGVEAVHIKTTMDLNIEPYQALKSSAKTQKAKDYLIKHNNGSTLVPIKANIVSFKMGREFDKLSVVGSVLGLKIDYVGVGKRAKELEEEMKPTDNAQSDEFQYAGTVLANYKLDADGDKNITGFFGLTHTLGGAGISYNQQVNDNLSYSIDGIIGQFPKTAIIAAAYSGNKYKTPNKSEKYIGFSINYKM